VPAARFSRIGQFGVGFFSASLVSELGQHICESAGGSTMICHLREDESEFLVKKHLEFIGFTIELVHGKLHEQKNEEEEEDKEDEEGEDGDEPKINFLVEDLLVKHFIVKGQLECRALSVSSCSSAAFSSLTAATSWASWIRRIFFSSYLARLCRRKILRAIRKKLVNMCLDMDAAIAGKKQGVLNNQASA